MMISLFNLDFGWIVNLMNPVDKKLNGSNFVLPLEKIKFFNDNRPCKQLKLMKCKPNKSNYCGCRNNKKNNNNKTFGKTKKTKKKLRNFSHSSNKKQTMIKWETTNSNMASHRLLKFLLHVLPFHHHDKEEDQEKENQLEDQKKKQKCHNNMRHNNDHVNQIPNPYKAFPNLCFKA